MVKTASALLQQLKQTESMHPGQNAANFQNITAVAGPIKDILSNIVEQPQVATFSIFSGIGPDMIIEPKCHVCHKVLELLDPNDSTTRYMACPDCIITVNGVRKGRLTSFAHNKGLYDFTSLYKYQAYKPENPEKKMLIKTVCVGHGDPITQLTCEGRARDLGIKMDQSDRWGKFILDFHEMVKKANWDDPEERNQLHEIDLVICNQLDDMAQVRQNNIRDQEERDKMANGGYRKRRRLGIEAGAQVGKAMKKLMTNAQLLLYCCDASGSPFFGRFCQQCCVCTKWTCLAEQIPKNESYIYKPIIPTNYGNKGRSNDLPPDAHTMEHFKRNCLPYLWITSPQNPDFGSMVHAKELALSSQIYSLMLTNIVGNTQVLVGAAMPQLTDEARENRLQSLLSKRK